MYFIQKNLTRFHNIGYTYFLNPNELNQIKYSLKKGDYSIYSPYPDSEKNILYKTKVPDVLLYEIKSKVLLRHQDILGTMYSLDISNDLFGDIILYDNRYFIFILPIIRNYFLTNLIMIRNSHVELVELSVDYLDNYYREFERMEFIVSSNRVDTVISSVIHTGRSNITNYIKKKEILLNYDYLKDTSYKLKDGDTFSIKGIGKFRYNGIIKNTKSNHLIIEILKYK